MIPTDGCEPVRGSVLAGVLVRQHVLLEDVPGTGKTLTARVLAQALALKFNRIQFTPDLLPSDITGSTIYNEHKKTFEFDEEPVFASLVLADEINRAPPKTQAALLEAMEEKQVTIDGATHALPDPFFVVATQNPIEQEGTFELPEAQRDRFIVKTSMGYPERAGELELVDRRSNRRTHVPDVRKSGERARTRGGGQRRQQQRAAPGPGRARQTVRTRRRRLSPLPPPAPRSRSTLSPAVTTSTRLSWTVWRFRSRAGDRLSLWPDATVIGNHSVPTT